MKKTSLTVGLSLVVLVLFFVYGSVNLKKGQAQSLSNQNTALTGPPENLTSWKKIISISVFKLYGSF